MPSISQLVQGAIIFVIMLVLLWIAFYLFVIALVLGFCAAAFVFIRRWLIDKGIVNGPIKPESSAAEEVDVIEVEYHEVDTSPDQKNNP